jgi:membrane associated rhomboid family serine protease
MFLLLPVAVDYRASRQPVVTFSLIGVCVLMFLLTIAIGAGGGIEAFRGWFLSLALVPAENAPHTWVTSLITHAGIFHLLGNMIYLYLFGACAEDILGRGKYIAFFLLGGIIANWVQVVTMPDRFASETPIVGASGAISACMGMFAVLLSRTHVEFRFIYYFIFAGGSREFRLPSWLILSFWFALDALGMFASLGHRGGGTAFGAHVAGFLFGASVGAVVRLRGWELDGDPAAADEPVKPVPAAAGIRDDAEASGPGLYVWSNGSQAGPFPLRRVCEMRELGVLTGDCLYWDQDRNEWRPVVELPRS